MSVATPLTGSFATADLNTVINTNANLLNSLGSSSTAVFDDGTIDGQLTAGQQADVSLNDGPRIPIDYVGAGTFSTANLTIGLPPLLGVTVQVNPIDVGFFTTTVDGVTQNYLVSEDPLSVTNLTASVSGTLAGLNINLVNADLTEVADTLGLSLNQLLNQLVFSVEITEGAPLAGIDDALCFAKGTLILTTSGEKLVEDLQVGDLVLTADNGPKPILWIGTNKFSKSFLAQKETLRPIRISAGALGTGLPTSDLIVSPQHRILVRSAIAQKMFGTNEVLVAAKQLLQLGGVDIAYDIDEVQYTHFMFDQHEVVISNGAQTESLFTGPVALNSVNELARAEILAIFPELADEDYKAVPARLLASGRMGRRLAVRHGYNRKALVQEIH